MSAEDGVRGLDEVFRQAPLTEAIMFSADSIALGALLECTRRGIRVPEQLAICGVGNYELSPLVSPALTTVEVHVEEMGRRSAELLLALTEGERPDTLTIELTPKLIRRGSA
jgi:LacI family gluconate utilization system Gnt-I transcriptional repressor